MTEQELQEIEKKISGMVGYSVTHRGVFNSTIDDYSRLIKEVRRLQEIVKKYESTFDDLK